MFGTSGIRGVYGKEVHELLALRIGNLFSDKDVIIGRDVRATGESLSCALLSGILSSGKNAIDIGIVPTPTLALATKKLLCNGIMITASHNPEEYNGLKLFSEGREISRKKEQEITEKYNKNKLNYSEWNKVGKLKNYQNAIEDHKSLILSLIDQSEIKKVNPKIVVDSNSPAALITPYVLENLGCKVIHINNSIKGFSRPSEPNKANLSSLSKKVIEEKADFGIGHDGDADRAVIVDDNGEMLS
ncbi:MAG: phosphoglucosamine mutase, partial [Candidatus ainarchaeum sp.]|nr:phosphoglucosamine mutase [Candidatus ainarchaeum sp.]